MFEKFRNWFLADKDGQLQKRLEKLRQRAPLPVFWLFGRTQSGKTSVIKYLTGADDAEIGRGFQPCTRFSREYQFPTPEAPLLRFLDTRGVDEPGYTVEEELPSFNDQAHVVIVTVKALDHSQERVLAGLRQIRRAKPSRPVVLVLTCLHEAYPQQQHPRPYPFRSRESGIKSEGSENPCPLAADSQVSDDLQRSLQEQCRRFEGLVTTVVPVDLTRPDEGFHEPNYGGEQLKQALLAVLPAAYRQTLLNLDEAKRELQDLFSQHVVPHILGYSSLAATAGAIPVPMLDLFILPVIQSRMIYHLAQLYGQPLSAARFLEVASTLGLGVVLRQASREVMKFIPYVGSVAGAILGGASTFALGKAFCYYYSAVHEGHVPQSEELRRYYQEQLSLAEKAWAAFRKGEMEKSP
jgi:uncharacterized protein (DUF697 family)